MVNISPQQHSTTNLSDRAVYGQHFSTTTLHYQSLAPPVSVHLSHHPLHLLITPLHPLFILRRVQTYALRHPSTVHTLYWVTESANHRVKLLCQIVLGVYLQTIT